MDMVNGDCNKREERRHTEEERRTKKEQLRKKTEERNKKKDERRTTNEERRTENEQRRPKSEDEERTGRARPKCEDPRTKNGVANTDTPKDRWTEATQHP